MLLKGDKPQPRDLASSCYSLIAPDFALAIAGKYRPHDGQFTEIEGTITASPVNPAVAARAQEAKSADAWFAATTGELTTRARSKPRCVWRSTSLPL